MMPLLGFLTPLLELHVATTYLPPSSIFLPLRDTFWIYVMIYEFSV